MSRTKLAAEAWGSVLRTHAALVPELDRVLQSKAGLPIRWYDVLLELDSTADGRLTMGELADRVVLSRSRVSRVVDELLEARLVRKQVNDGDRRSAYATITASGRKAFVRAAPVYRTAIADLFAAQLSDAELATVRDVLDRVLGGTRPSTR
jgi:DNA-binding MarR family transcriptional regulator